MKANANNDMLWLESSTAGTFNLVKGQGDLKRSGGSDKIDATSKDSGGTKVYLMGFSDLGWTLDVMPDLPDTNGYTRLETLCNAYPKMPFNIQIRKNGTAGGVGDVIWAGSVYGNITSGDYSQNKPRTISFEFVPAAEPTTDALA